MSENWKFDTLQVHAGQILDSDHAARALPIYQTTSYVFKDNEQARNRFALTEPGMIYTRITNPTQSAVENRIAALYGGTGGLLLASGSAAATYAILNVAHSGQNIVASASLYGGTFNLFKYTLPTLGIEVRFVHDAENIDAWEELIDDNTRALYGETLPNPQLDVLDIEPIAALAHNNGIPLIVDNTVPTPWIVNPFDFGADVVIDSVTKFMGGHGTTIAGSIVERAGFDWKNGKFPALSEPDESYHGITFADVPGAPFTTRVRATLLRDTGAAISPISAFLIAQGLETLSLRMERHLSNTRAVIDFLLAHPAVASVNYPSLETSKYHALAEKYCPKGAGSLFTIDLAGGFEAAAAFVENLKLFSNLANIGDAKSLVVHPASTTHSQLNAQELAVAGISPATVRLSIGIEDPSDIIADIKQALDSLK
ncbi:O-acetylhomoserine aminocarboxypropyltransferase/cysteine synthase family protein [Actinotignum urinale]|uniref:O-acetylhomoserine aminocarboxypropyltransferase/cysteine synthase family protein n=1 Tax=Actinotignum urinale TaxID=190146 RepID=UPI002A804B7F|nr:O-acetylhomoserine aminocarboxypropyltransferase/cysteine synthase family protein [Actinotignum urinale]MDY5151545.1 O-acetylhomoserine aminocarboxypropyltransferase/cysteine synthase family protein [Actinotignum urinale]